MCRRWTGIALVVGVGWSAAVVQTAQKADVARPAEAAAAQQDARPLAERIAEIAKEHKERREQFRDELRAISRERKQLSEAEYGEKVSRSDQEYSEYVAPVAKELIALIKANRKDPDVLEGLILLNGPMSHSLNVDPELVGIVLEDQIANPKLGRLCHDLRYANNDAVAEAILKAAAEKHPSRDVRGQATYALGEYYRQTARDDWGRPHTPQQTAWLLENAAKYLQHAIDNFADVKTPEGKNLGEAAATTLTRVRNIPNLKVGKPAPEVSGEGVDGQPIALADFRGKVVVIVFWGSWCGPCMAMVPHERELVERMKDRPFVLVGVNCGDERDVAGKTMDAKQMTWPSLWDGDTHAGPVQSAYNVLHWPTVYVLDAAGTIRYIEPEGKELDAAVDALVAETEAAAKG